MNSNDIVVFNINPDNLERAVKKALEMDFIDNLRDRNQFVKLDSKIRGYLGEFLIVDILENNNIDVESTWVSEEDDTDIDISINNNYHDNLKIEVKTSLIPDRWNSLEKVFELGDIKIIKRENDYHHIKSDFHVQVYFNFLTKSRDAFLKKITGDVEDYSINELIHVMDLGKLRHAFVAWIDKNTLIEQLDRLPSNDRTWHFSYRDFWYCKIKDSKKYSDFVVELESYTKNY